MELIRIILLSYFIASLNGQKYEDTRTILKTLLNSSIYSPEVIPVSDQSESINVTVSFYLVSIVAVDEATESFICNGFMVFEWTDQRLQWNPEDYGNQTLIKPLPTKIWRPRVILVNTLNNRYPFSDEVSTGNVMWSPGNLFAASCALDLLKYPFDKQMCNLTMFPMSTSEQLTFLEGTVELYFYHVNGEWDLIGTGLEAPKPINTGSGFSVLTFKVSIHIRRRPMFYMLNVILPFVLLSFLNMLVFTIPQESGEKITYGITVLMTLSVFFSIIGGTLPRSSIIVPNIIIYLVTLYIISSLAVIDSIIIVYIYRFEERKEQNRKMSESLKRSGIKMKRPKSNTVEIQANPEVSESDANLRKERSNSLLSPSRLNVTVGPEKDEEQNQYCFNKKALASSIDFYSGIIFLATWLAVTMWYFLSVRSE